MDSIPENNEYADYDDRIIDVNDRRVWLLKVPQFLYNSWSEFSTPNTDLGIVRIENTGNPGEIPKISMILNDSSVNADIPKNYNLNYIKNPQSKFVFAENEEGKAVSIAGSIQYEFHVNPEMNDEYRKIMKERSLISTKPKRTTQFVDESMSGTKFNLLAPMNDARPAMKMSKRHLSPDTKRERLPKPELMDLLFRAFEREPYWSMKALIDHSNQPTVLLVCFILL